jgi:hypothetical protein
MSQRFGSRADAEFNGLPAAARPLKNSFFAIPGNKRTPVCNPPHVGWKGLPNNFWHTNSYSRGGAFLSTPATVSW